MSLCESVIKILEEEALKQDFSQVKTLWLEIGDLSSVEVESFVFCFKAVSQTSKVALNTKLEIIRVEGQAWCLDCADNVNIKARYDACPRCGGYSLQVSNGTQMQIKELEVE